MTATEPASTTDAWTAEIEQLRSRYKHASPAILAALNILVKQNDISIEDAKAKAELHGARITTASMNAAKTLLAKMDAQDIAAETPRVSTASPAPARAARRPRTADATLDAEALIKNVVAKIQGQGNVEAERLRDGIRKAIAALQGVLG